MDKTDKFMLYLCRCSLLNEKAEISNTINYTKLFNLAKAHNLIGVCHCALAAAQSKESLVPEIKNAFLNRFLDLVYLYEMQSNALSEAESILTASDTPYIVFKGAVLRSYYPVPEARAMGDIDILIQSDNRDKVKSAFVQSGWKCTKKNGPVYNYEKNGVLIEMHTRLIGEYNQDVFAQPFEHAEFDGLKGHFDNNFHFAYLIAHTAHHFRFYGAGAKLILDLAVMLQYADIDLNTVFCYLDAVGLGKFGKTILTVCSAWFGTDTDYKINTAKTQDYLLGYGAFGAERESAADVILRKELEEGKKNGAFRSKFRLAFPSYSKLREIEYIKFIDGRPYLTPYAWCYRFFYNFRHRRNFVSNAVSALGDKDSKTKAAEELAFFEEIGLV